MFMPGVCWRCPALVALVTLIPAIGSPPLHDDTCEASTSHGPAGAEIGRCLLQQQLSSDRRAKLSLHPFSSDNERTVGRFLGERIIAEEENEATITRPTPAAHSPPQAGGPSDAHGIISEVDQTELVDAGASAKIRVSTATIANSGNGVSSRDYSSNNGSNNSNQHSSIAVHIAHQDPHPSEVGSGVAWHGERKHKTANTQVAGEAVSVERQERRKGVLSMVSTGLLVSRQYTDHVFAGLAMKVSMRFQQALSLASRTWASVHAKQVRSGSNMMMGIAALVLIVAGVCTLFMACRGHRTASNEVRSPFSTGTRARVFSDAGAIQWTRSQRNRYSGMSDNG